MKERLSPSVTFSVTFVRSFGILFRVDCVDQIAIELPQLGYAGLIEDVVQSFAEDSFLIFLSFNLNQSVDRDLKRIGHIEDHFKRGAFLCPFNLTPVFAAETALLGRFVKTELRRFSQSAQPLCKTFLLIHAHPSLAR